MRVPSLCDNGPLRARLQMQNNVSCDFESGFRVLLTYACIYQIFYDPVRHNTADLRHLGQLVVFLFITNSMIVTYVPTDMEGT
jgi:hypothetical protein